MNKLLIIILAILGGIDTTLRLFTPILLSTLWMSIARAEGWQFYFIVTIGLLATLFRAIKIAINK